MRVGFVETPTPTVSPGATEVAAGVIPESVNSPGGSGPFSFCPANSTIGENNRTGAEGTNL